MSADSPNPRSSWGASQRSWLRRRARGLLSRRAHRSFDASDAADEALLAAKKHRHRTTLDSRAQERGWLRTILRNVIITRIRREGRQIEWEEWTGDRMVADGAGPLDAAMKNEEGCNVRELLDALPERGREVVRLRIEQDLPFAEIGRRLGLAEGHVRVVFHRSLQELRQRAQSDEPLD